MSGVDNQENLAWQANKSVAECHRYVAAGCATLSVTVIITFSLNS